MHLQTLMMIIVALTKNSLLSGMASIVIEALLWRLVMLQMISTQLSLSPSIHDYIKNHNTIKLIWFLTYTMLTYTCIIHIQDLLGWGKWPVKHWGSKLISIISLHTGIDSMQLYVEKLGVHLRKNFAIHIATHLPLYLKYSALLPMFNC